ncbi:MAG: DUF1194 domain-containing protein [Roseococcus sp.]
MSACALALVLLLDASASISPQEWQLQAEGHAAAFDDAAVLRAIARGPGVAVTALSFSDDARDMVALAHPARPGRCTRLRRSLAQRAAG